MNLVLAKPVPLIRRRRKPLVVKASVDPIETTGKFLGLFVLFTSSMNWWYYRQKVKDAERNNKK